MRTTKGPAAERRKAQAGPVEPDETAGPTPFYRGPWFWTLAVIVVIGGALGVSFAVGSDYRDPEVGSEDVTAFCASAKSYSASVASGPPAEGGQSRQFGAFADQLQGLVGLAPPSMTTTVQRLATETKQLSAEIAKIETDHPGELSAPLIEGSLSRFEKRNQPDIDRFAAYLKKACNIDLGAGDASSGSTPTS